MELELGLKITKTLDGPASTDFRLAKDRAGPVFISTETDSMFILTAHLKGFRRKNIKVDINEEGTRIAISGEKPVQEMVMMGWAMIKKQAEMRGFRKVFKIPEGVVLDRIKAMFEEEESILTISMPKLQKGIVGIGIEEVKLEKQVTEPEAETSQQAIPRETVHRTDAAEGAEPIREAEPIKLEEEKKQEKDIHKSERREHDTDEMSMPPLKKLKKEEAQEDKVDGSGTTKSAKLPESTSQEKPYESKPQEEKGLQKEGKEDVQQKIEAEADREHRGSGVEGLESEIREASNHEVGEEYSAERGEDETRGQLQKPEKKKCKLFSPCFFVGSALIASIVVLVVSLIGSQRRS
ncbi:hypothetical protein Ancab_038553 [Ancistrocladus abbreviatus]